MALRLQRFARTLVSQGGRTLSSSTTTKGINLRLASQQLITNRNAHAKPAIAWELSKSLGVTTQEELEKRIEGIEVSLHLCFGSCVGSCQG